MSLTYHSPIPCTFQWEHSVALMTPANKHSITTMYATRGAGSHQVISTLDLQDLDPMTLTGDVDLDPKDLKLTTSLQHGKVR